MMYYGWKQGFKNPPRYTPPYYQRLVGVGPGQINITMLDGGVATDTFSMMMKLALSVSDGAASLDALTEIARLAGSLLDSGVASDVPTLILRLAEAMTDGGVSADAVTIGFRLQTLVTDGAVSGDLVTLTVQTGGGGRTRRREWMRRLRENHS